MDKFLSKIKKLCATFLQNEDMGKHTTFCCGGRARFYLEPNSTKNLVKLIKILNKENAKYFVLGAGSNTLIKDFGGFVICTRKLNKIKLKKTHVFCQCGAQLFKLNGVLAKNGLGGLEFSYGIPGSVGGACAMNAGAFGGQFADVVQKVMVFDGKKIRIIKKCKLGFEYRNSQILKNNWIVLGVWLECYRSKSDLVFANMKDFMKKRIQSQPTQPSAGSIFKRIDDKIPAKIIDNLGLKGVKINGAQVSPKHAGFIVNNGNATCQDIERLVLLVKDRVKSQCNIDLQTEIKIVGDEDGPFG